MEPNDSKIYFFTEDNVDVMDVYDNDYTNKLQTISGFQPAILQTGITTKTSSMKIAFTR